MELDPQFWLEHIVRSAAFGIGGLILFFLTLRFFLQKDFAFGLASLMGIVLLHWFLLAPASPPGPVSEAPSPPVPSISTSPRWIWLSLGGLAASVALGLAYALGQALQRQKQEIASPDEQAALAFLSECQQRGLTHVRWEGAAHVFQVCGSHLVAGTRSFSLRHAVFFPEPRPHLQLADQTRLDFVTANDEDNPPPTFDIETSQDEKT